MKLARAELLTLDCLIARAATHTSDDLVRTYRVDYVPRSDHAFKWSDHLDVYH